MSGLDILGSRAGRLDPSGAGQKTEASGQTAAGAAEQVQRGRFDGRARNAHRRQALLEMLGGLGGGPGAEVKVTANA
jgi:hypothetical protein